MAGAIDARTWLELGLVVSAAFQNIALAYIAAKFGNGRHGPPPKE